MPPPNKKSVTAAPKVDGNTFLRFLLSYEDYLILMLLLFTLGLLSGLIGYVYSRPTYSSTALLRVNQFVDSSQTAEGGRANNYNLMRSIMLELGSGHLILEACKSLGLASESTSYNTIRESLVPAVRIGILDSSHIELGVLGFTPGVVRELPAAIAETYEAIRVRQRIEFREKAIKRYVDEIAIVRAKVSAQLDTQLKFEEESALASAQIELERLSNVPVELVRMRFRLGEMERVRGILDDQKSVLGEVGLLALLTSLPAVTASVDPLSSGTIVRNSGASAAPFTFSSPTKATKNTQVVVQPEMVDGLEPWQDLEKKKRTLEEKMRLTRTKFLDDHPEMIKLSEELREVTSALNLELEVARKAFELEYVHTKDQIKKLEEQLPDYHKATKSFDEKKMGYDLMKKGQLAWDKAYEELSRQIEGLQFGGDVGAVDIEFRGFIEVRSEIPVSPGKAKLAMMGCMLGIGLAGGVPYLFRRFSTSVSDLNEFEHTLGIPGIGLVPLTNPQILEDINRSPTVGATTPNALLENFRLIRSSIILNKSPKGDMRVMMVTSARPSEGKTTVAVNTAWAFSSLGERTLVIDCDLRRGRVHKVAGVANHPGMTDLLTGAATIEQCIQKSPADNLWLLPRGAVVPGTTELLNTAVFLNILEKLKGVYDRIILDTPPVLGLSETAFLQNYTDGVVLVVKSDSTPRKDVEEAFRALEKLGAHFYGFVLNRVDFTKRSNHYYYYYYSSSYYDSNWETGNEAPEPPARKASPFA
jgi:succinoglycan biosynthesis transport protein ExoP